MEKHPRNKPFTPPSDLPVAKADLAPPPKSKSGLGICPAAPLNTHAPLALKMAGRIFAAREKVKRSEQSEMEH
jgi:hypothetical protein